MRCARPSAMYKRLNPANTLRDAMSPLRQIGADLKADLQRSASVEKPATPLTPAVAADESPKDAGRRGPGCTCAGEYRCVAAFNRKPSWH